MATHLPIADKTTLDEVKALIGTASPSSGDLTTLFKGLKLIANYVDTLENSLAAGVTWGRTYTSGSYSTTSASWQTALNLSGKGSLLGVFVNVDGNNSQIRVTIDGVVVYEGGNLSFGNYYLGLPLGAAPPPAFYSFLRVVDVPVPGNPLDFKTSLKIEVASMESALTKVFWGYNM